MLTIVYCLGGTCSGLPWCFCPSCENCHWACLSNELPDSVCVIYDSVCYLDHGRRLIAEFFFGGDGKNFHGPNFREKFHFNAENVWGLFWSSTVFCLSFACLYCLKSDIAYNTFKSKYFLLDTFFNQFVLCHASSNTTSGNIGVTDAWAVAPPQILGGPSTSTP